MAYVSVRGFAGPVLTPQGIKCGAPPLPACLPGSVEKALLDWQILVGADQTGVLDEQTRQLTREFQKVMSLPQTGTPDAWTKAHGLPRPLRKGLVGDDVKALQRMINALPIDGQFGEGTRAALLAYQARRQLPETGVVDFDTRARLLFDGVPAVYAAEQAQAQAQKPKPPSAQPPAEGKPAPSTSTSSGSSTGLLVMLGVVAIAGYLFWATPRARKA